MGEAAAVTPYRPGTLVDLAGWLADAAESELWLMVSEFLHEYKFEPPGERLRLLEEEPPPVGDEHWDVFLAALAEHLAAREGRRGPAWAERRSLRQFWFPFNTRAARVDAFVHAPPSFRSRGVFVAERALDVA